jgi:hypothetical protein
LVTSGKAEVHVDATYPEHSKAGPNLVHDTQVAQQGPEAVEIEPKDLHIQIFARLSLTHLGEDRIPDKATHKERATTQSLGSQRHGTHRVGILRLIHWQWGDGTHHQSTISS